MFVPRKDPIIWGDVSGPLSSTQLDTFREQGFLLFPELLRQLDPDLLAHCTADSLTLRDNPDQASFIWEERTHSIRSIYNAHNLSEACALMVQQPHLRAICRQLLASEVYVHQTHINYKHAFFGENFFWHQDFTFWHYEDGMPHMRVVGVALFLNDVGYENGPLMVIPGSHALWLPRRWKDRTDRPNEAARHNLVDSIEDNGLISPDGVRLLCSQNQIVPIVGPHGTVLVYDGNLAHASSDNLSPQDRMILFIFYNSVDNALINPTRPEYIATRSIPQD